jgi:DNA polymerase III subunit beta
MKFTVTSKALKGAITEAVRVVSGNVTLPALSGVKLEVTGGNLTLVATDLDTNFEQTLEGTAESNGVALVPARMLKAVMGKITDDELTLSADDKGEKVEITTTLGTLSIRGMQRDDFPKLNNTDDVELHEVDGLPGLLKRVAVAASSDESRPVLTGVYFDGDVLAATDSYRLTVAQVPGLDVQALVPARTMQQIVASKPKRLEIGAHPHGLVLEDPDARRRWLVRFIEGSFPNYEALMPTGYEARVYVGRKTFQTAVDMVATVAMGQANTPITMEANGDLVLSAVNQELGNIEQTVRGYRKEGPDTTIAFNPAFVGHILKQQLTGDEVVIELRDGLKPAVFSDPEDATVRTLLMPMRVS